MSFKGISLIWSAGGPFVQRKRNHLCNFGRGYQEKQFGEIILNLEQPFRRCLLMTFPIWSSVGSFVQQTETICAVLVEGIMRNNYNMN